MPVILSKGKPGKDETPITKLSQLENDVGFVTEEQIINYGISEALWENAYPASNFIGQTLNLQIPSYYRFILVLYRRSTSNDHTVSSLCLRGGYSSALCIQDGVLSLRNVGYNSDGSVTFSNGFTVPSYGSDTTNNGKMVPRRVYGIR